MDKIDFEATLRTDGFTEIETLTLRARTGQGTAPASFLTRGLVLAGSFVVKDDGPAT
jgi:hypothetical protein